VATSDAVSFLMSGFPIRILFSIEAFAFIMRDTETGTAEPHAEKIDPTTIHDCGQVVELVTNTEYNWISGWRLHLISLGLLLHNQVCD